MTNKIRKQTHRSSGRSSGVKLREPKDRCVVRIGLQTKRTTHDQKLIRANVYDPRPKIFLCSKNWFPENDPRPQINTSTTRRGTVTA